MRGASNNRLPLPQAKLPGFQPQSRQPISIIPTPQTTHRLNVIINTNPIPRLPSSSNPFQRCRQIQSDPSLAAEVLIRERLVSSTEGEIYFFFLNL